VGPPTETQKRAAQTLRDAMREKIDVIDQGMCKLSSYQMALVPCPVFRVTEQPDGQRKCTAELRASSLVQGVTGTSNAVLQC
jgi:hypothetical protein